MRQTAICFLKKYTEKGNIQMMTESEIRYVKKLLKEKNHEYWSDDNILRDLHRHAKYTIRKLTFQMANIDNYAIFKRNKEPTRENVLFLVYRAERLFSALTDAEKIFKLISITLFDERHFEDINSQQSIKKEDQIFLKKREIYFRRVLTQVNTFLETYRLFKTEFVFKGTPIKEYILSQMDKAIEAKQMMDQKRKDNPELAE